MEIRFSVGAAGYLVRRLQEGLRRVGAAIAADGDYGPRTQQAVLELQRARGLVVSGDAGPQVFGALGLEWPEVFERCLNLTASFEGTGFGGSCGPADTGDSAGVTFGIVGFTSYNGELQALLRSVRLLIGAPRFDVLAEVHCGRGCGAKIRELIDASAPAGALGAWAISGGKVIDPVKAWLGALGALPEMQATQLRRARLSYWDVAVRQAELLMGVSGRAQVRNPAGVVLPDRLLALLFDVAVQNGGLKRAEIEAILMAGVLGTRLLELIAETVESRLIQNRRPYGIIKDVAARKRTIAAGEGRVHGRTYRVGAFAL